MSAPHVGPRRLVYQSPRQRVFQRTVDFGAFQKEYFVAEVGTRVGMVLTRGEQVLLVRQYRFVINAQAWEIPGGKVDDHEMLKDAAIRETFEETGLRCHNAEPLLFFQPGMDTFVNPTHVFRSAHFTAERDFAPDPAEVTELAWVPIEECLRRIFRGEIVDSFTITALLGHHATRLDPTLHGTASPHSLSSPEPT